MRKRHSAENGVRCELHFDFRAVLESKADVVFSVDRNAVDHPDDIDIEDTVTVVWDIQ